MNSALANVERADTALLGDNVGKVIDIFSREEFSEDEQGFYDRFQDCYDRFLEKGYCPCEICDKKREIAFQTITYAKNQCNKYMKETGQKLFWGDLLEVLLIAGRETKDFIDYGGEEE